MTENRRPALAALLSLPLLLLATLLLSAPAAAQVEIVSDEPNVPQDTAPEDRASEAATSAALPTDTPEPGSAEAIRRFTTAPEYLPASVASVPESLLVPSPSDVLGHVAGAPGELSSVAEVHGYLRELAAASPRVEVRTIGRSEEGREMLLVLVSDEANLANLPRLTEINRRLADPRVAVRGEMEALVEEGRAVYYLIGGLHSTETGSPEMLMELAYRLAVSERPEIRHVRDQVVVAITPVAEPDGRDRVVEWYERNLRDRDFTQGDLSWEDFREIGSPPYWGRYVFHDNNRDGMQRALALTRAIQDTFYELRPQVVHDLHESLPLLYISTGHGPYSPAIDPVTINQWTGFAHHEAAALQAQGLPGVWVWGFWDGWWPGYLVSVANNHNSVGRFYETFGNSHPGTFERDLSDVRYVGKPVTEVQWYRPWPPDETVTWSLRNNTNYMQAGVLEALEYAARHRRELLENGWVKARRALDRGRTEAPHAWVFPLQQDDPGRLTYLVNQLLAHGIEVHRLVEPPPAEPGEEGGPATGETAAGETAAGEETGDAAEQPPSWPAGSYVVRLDQPARNAAVTFLAVQRFPPEEPNPPYDDVAWTWPLLYGVDGERVDDPAILEQPMEPLGGPVAAGGGVTGYGEDLFLLADRGQTSLLAARVSLGSYQVDAAEEPFEVNGVPYPAGSWIVQAPSAAVAEVGARLGLTFRAALSMPRVPVHLVDLPRLGLVHTWTSTQDAGWARYTLEREGMPFELVSPDDLRRGDLLSRFDVLLVPPLWGDFARMVHGIDPAWGPLPYTASPQSPSHGVPNGSPDVTGGMGLTGLLELQRFVAGGGVLVAVGNSGRLAVDGGLVRRVERTSPPSLRNPGSELAARVVWPGHPVTYGYGERPSVFRGNGALFQVPDRLRGERVVLQFGDELEERGEGGDGGERQGDGAGVLPEDDIVVEEIEAEPVPLVEEEAAQEEPVAGEAAAMEPQEEGEGGPDGEEAEPAGAADATPAPRELVLSGWVSDPDALGGEPAILDVPSGSGRVLLFAFNPLHRHLNHSDFRFLYNVFLHWNDLP